MAYAAPFAQKEAAQPLEEDAQGNNQLQPPSMGGSFVVAAEGITTPGAGTKTSGYPIS